MLPLPGRRSAGSASRRRRRRRRGHRRADWSEAGRGDALFDLATLTLGHRERLGDVLVGYGTDVDLDVIRAWWSVRSLLAIRWLVEHGFDPASPGCEIDVLRSAGTPLTDR
ncbi:hypothetical protein [Micromonospora sp. Llam0]|uniref:hypothetical protein n=1 Tax=Micromonospora sp. Llam0 TaxID=2485143 RepID=UPI0018F5F028|nr:hypothetical protein [Micromonospora sp. Llam0]